MFSLSRPLLQPGEEAAPSELTAKKRTQQPLANRALALARERNL